MTGTLNKYGSFLHVDPREKLKPPSPNPPQKKGEEKLELFSAERQETNFLPLYNKCSHSESFKGLIQSSIKWMERLPLISIGFESGSNGEPREASLSREQMFQGYLS